MAKYFFRLDDISPNMNWENFYWLRELFKRHDAKPLLAVIPDNQDPELLKYPGNPDFWGIINELYHSGWVIAQHGYQHFYKTRDGGILNINLRSEFAGLDFQTQNYQIAAGKQILKEKSVDPKIFVAPSHSFDKNTLKTLAQNGFHYVSDGIALYPFKKRGLVWLPQIFWRPRKFAAGLITIALHPNTMSREDLTSFQNFIEKNKSKIGDFSELMRWHKKSGIFKKFFTFLANQVFKIVWWVFFKFKTQNAKVKSTS
ncbi:hypothetical protein A2833_00575 [Candidatus Azambacteria bacterium RIFCSPHIGHO2_01_FULL_44_55]|uniref:NodB homology domain-containing protein n=1 Tax=Candidatus Azambacteria bacterium RIFCSPLOWO2_02_FULL_44_14 TaxID=1797306 RepID=A0A1F5CCC6_9BACT|nr:MAG: hypothetical protein A3A18_01320 [Candidatus Azambacteria bacterium RIFCSPLOWO2_01_FULL_44_84]OGD40502.1 MAG: hypothetical protein A3I30_00860 [Candidatus Azambacteria bacterium RIFCSPLOWO2_02_FULL_44_14]OGD41739.1 MAG: hypothetical protein A2833_00575 [Candidatus Azambacteria bacterium RIFCSPHIGHO2_01_FULL_44_55]